MSSTRVPSGVMNLMCLSIFGCLVVTTIAYSIPKKYPSEIFSGQDEHEKAKTIEGSKAKFSPSNDGHKVGNYLEPNHPIANHGGVPGVGVRDLFNIPRTVHNRKLSHDVDSHESEEDKSAKNRKDDDEEKKKEEKGEEKQASDRIFGPGLGLQPPYWRNDYDSGINRNIFSGTGYGRPSYYSPIDGRSDIYGSGIGYNGGILNRDGYGTGYGGLNRDLYGIGYGGVLNADGYGSVNSLYPGRDGYYLGSDGLGYGRNGIYGISPGRDGYGLFPVDRNLIYGTRPFTDIVNYSDPSYGSYGRGRNGYGYTPDLLRPLYPSTYGSGAYGSQAIPEVRTQVDLHRDSSPSEEVKSLQEPNPNFLA